MEKKVLITIFVSMLFIFKVTAQPSQRGVPGQADGGAPASGLLQGIDMGNTQTSFMVNINPMSKDKREKLDRMADRYRAGSQRGVIADLGNAALAGGVGAVVNVIGNEIINLIQIRSKQKKAWQAMRQKECIFTDSLQSVKGQSDFYARQSSHGFLDPSDMNFDGITFRADRGGKEVLRMVCHIDTSRLDHMFLHSKFYLVLDSLSFHPYRSFLPNLNANHITEPRRGEATQDEIDYWNTISHFSFSEQLNPTINIRIDLSSSWISDQAQVYSDVPLGSFSVNIPVVQNDLKGDTVYLYSRKDAIALHQQPIEMAGDCFVVPRSYMPVDAYNPSWGTGEYKMKVVLTESCRYDPEKGRASNWHRDYKQLVRMQNHGKAHNEYLSDIVTTFRDNATTILKATYNPILTGLVSYAGIGGTSSAGGMGAMKGGMPSGAGAQVMGATGGQQGEATTGGQKPGATPEAQKGGQGQGGTTPPDGGMPSGH